MEPTASCFTYCSHYPASRAYSGIRVTPAISKQLHGQLQGALTARISLPTFLRLPPCRKSWASCCPRVLSRG